MAAKDVDGIAGLQAEDGDHWASMFRPYRGRVGLRAYLRECFDGETRPAEVWFGDPQVDGDTASVEYWAVTYPNDRPFTISGCTLLRFDDAGLVTEARDYSHAKEATPAARQPVRVMSHARGDCHQVSGAVQVAGRLVAAENHQAVLLNQVLGSVLVIGQQSGEPDQRRCASERVLLDVTPY